MARPRVPVQNRFWTKVHKQDGNQCWLWTGAKNKQGYGTIECNGTRAAHRIGYELTYGPIPEGMIVLHTCDNPPCVRPDHLRVGNNER